MSSPTFILANETNHVLLKSLLEAMNGIVDHQYECMSTEKLLLGGANMLQQILHSSIPFFDHKKDSMHYETLWKKEVNQN